MGDHDTNPRFRIVQLQVENVKRIKAVDLTPPASGAVVVAGNNRQGKTSILKSIQMAFSGGSKEYESAIRDGTDALNVWINCGEFSVRRVVKRDGKQEVQVRMADGLKIASPQEFLDKIRGTLAFDPIAFRALPPRARRDRLIDLAGIGPQLEQATRRADIAYQERTDRGRDLKQADAVLAQFGSWRDLPEQKVDVAEAMRNLREANEQIAEGSNLVTRGRSADSEIAAARERIARASSEIDRWTMELRAATDCESVAQDKKRSLEGEVAMLPLEAAHRTAEAMRARIEDADRINQQVNVRAQAQAAHEAAEKARAAHRAAEDAITAAHAEADDVLRAATFPIEGLAFDGDDVTFGGRKFSDLSASETLRISIAIAMAGDPALRVILIDDAEKLDAESRAAVNDLAREHDFQIWEAVVGAPDGAFVVIEDGLVAKERSS